MRKTMLWSTILVLLLAVGGAAQATFNSSDWFLWDTLTWSSTNSEIYATDGWANANTSFTWGLKWTYSTSPVFTYYYQFSVPEKDISHFLIEVSPQPDENPPFPLADIFGDDGSSNPGIPTTMWSLKYDGTSTLLEVSFTSNIGPEWGDFYAKDGTDKQDDGTHLDVYAYNTGFTSSDVDSLWVWSDVIANSGWTFADPYSNQVTLKPNEICRPDTSTNGENLPPVPEPSSVALLILALGAGLYSGGKRLRRKA
ncbi:MAG: PEP-CTERM sorting domain-containing protein [Armatimonadetes bacterium]|nr:PEP-CTERM sorting domain-containing protein [Armatimonadota bacterium]